MYAIKICHAHSENDQIQKCESCRQWTKQWTNDLGNPQAGQKIR